jgi:hypothetical protein
MVIPARDPILFVQGSQNVLKLVVQAAGLPQADIIAVLLVNPGELQRFLKLLQIGSAHNFLLFSFIDIFSCLFPGPPL